MAQLQNIADKSHFTQVMNKFTVYRNSIDPGRLYIQDCCTEDIKTNLFNITQTIKNINTGNITYNDICISVLALYYKLNLIDYSLNKDILNDLIDSKDFANDPHHVKDLIMKMSLDDMIIEGENLSQSIRRYMLFGDSTHVMGGRSKARRSKARRSKARRSKARKSKAHRSKAHRSKARRSKAHRRKKTLKK